MGAFKELTIQDLNNISSDDYQEFKHSLPIFERELSRLDCQDLIIQALESSYDFLSILNETRDDNTHRFSIELDGLYDTRTLSILFTLESFGRGTHLNNATVESLQYAFENAINDGISKIFVHSIG